MKIFRVKRTVLEVYEVFVNNKKEAKTIICDPSSVTVVKEVITEIDDDPQILFDSQRDNTTNYYGR